MVKASDVVYKYYEVEFTVKHKKDGSKASFVEVSIGYEHDGVRYYFQKNLQGDVARIFNANGYLVARYVYDAWGNHTVYDSNGNINTDENFIGNINPFRYNVGASFSLINQTKQKLRFYVYHPYAPIETAQKMPLQASIFLLVLRGYYYDVETGLYYLNTRYYDPFACRFINADDISYIEPETINGLNLYAYCLNNPIIYSDPYGTWSWSSFWRGLGYIITGVGAIVAGALVMASGVALVPMLIAAGVTIGAGALTTINGAAEIGEAIGGYNYMKDGVFGGNATAYNIYAGITDGIAMIGSIICGAWLKVNAPRIQAYKNIASYEFSGTLSKSDHLVRSYQQSTLLQKNIIKFGKMVKETPGRYRFTIDGSFSIGWDSYGIGKSVQHPVMWKIVVDITKQIIYHAGF